MSCSLTEWALFSLLMSLVITILTGVVALTIKFLRGGQ